MTDAEFKAALDRAFREENKVLTFYPENPRAFFATGTLRTQTIVAVKACELDFNRGRRYVLYTKTGEPKHFFRESRTYLAALLMSLGVVLINLAEEDGKFTYRINEEVFSILQTIQSKWKNY